MVRGYYTSILAVITHFAIRNAVNCDDENVLKQFMLAGIYQCGSECTRRPEMLILLILLLLLFGGGFFGYNRYGRGGGLGVGGVVLVVLLVWLFLGGGMGTLRI